MNTLFKKLLPLMVFALLALPAKGQIRDNESSQSLLAIQCAMSSGYPASGYEEYCRRLAKTVGFLSAVQQERVFGYVPQPYAGSEEGDYVPPEYDQGGDTNYNGTDYGNNDEGGDGGYFEGSENESSEGSNTQSNSDSSSDDSGNNWWGEFFDWLNGILEDNGVDPDEMGAWVDEYQGSYGGDGNNGLGNDPGKFDSSNRGQSKKTGADETK